MRLDILCLLLLPGAAAFGRSRPAAIGKYTDYFTTLELRSDSTFHLSTPDPVYFFTHKVYESRGNWTLKDNVVVLNADKEERAAKVALVEKRTQERDSIIIKVNYAAEYFENETFLRSERTEMPVLTLYINKRRHYYNLVPRPVIRNCAFAPRVKRQRVVDSSYTLKLPRQQVEKIGIRTYGFDRSIELRPTDREANYFEIKIVQPLDLNRMPRNKKVILRGDNAFFHARDGRVQTGLFAMPLRRVKD